MSVPALLLLSFGPAVAACKPGSASSVKDDNALGPAGPAFGGFDVNDLSIMFPVGTDGTPYPNLTLAGLTDKSGKVLWPEDTAFQRMIDFATDANPNEFTDHNLVASADDAFPSSMTGDAGGLQSATALVDAPPVTFHTRRIGEFIDGNGAEQNDPGAKILLKPNSPVRDQSKWRVVALRADPCAEQDVNACNVEFRLVVQPISTGVAVDTSAHLLFNLGHLAIDGRASEIDVRNAGLPSDVTFQSLVDDLRAIKAQSATDGVPLGIHPGLAAELAARGGSTAANGPVAQLVVDLIKKYTQGGLTVVTSMQLVRPAPQGEPWIFFQGAVAGGTWDPRPITGGSQQMSVRFQTSATTFLPDPKNAFGSSNSTVLQGNPGPSDFANAFVIENPGVYGGPGPRASVNNMDCLSCHVGSNLLVFNTAEDPTKEGIGNMYVPTDGITGYMGVGIKSNLAAASENYSFRNFGIAASSTESSIEPRMVNEAAEAARFVNKIMFDLDKGPGFVCAPGADQAARAMNHAKLWTCIAQRLQPFDQCAQQVCGHAGGP